MITTEEPKPIVLHGALKSYINEVMPHMEGWCTKEKAIALAESVAEHKPNVVVEIGVFAGKSLIAIALGLKCNGQGKVYGIDPWTPEASMEGFDDVNRDWWAKVDHNYILDRCEYFVKHLGVKDQVALIKSTSEAALVGFDIARQFLGEPFIDLLHIDGNHSQEHALYDVENYVPLVKSGGIVFFDDINWSTTELAQVRLQELCDPLDEVKTEGQCCGIFRKKS